MGTGVSLGLNSFQNIGKNPKLIFQGRKPKIEAQVCYSGNLGMLLDLSESSLEIRKIIINLQVL